MMMGVGGSASGDADSDEALTLARVRVLGSRRPPDLGAYTALLRWRIGQFRRLLWDLLYIGR